MKLDKILKSKMIYYVALVLMVINVLGYVSMGSIECVVIFAVTTYLTNQFTKNRSVDILAGLFVANVVFGCGRIKEGFEPLEKKIEALTAEVATCKKGDKKCHKNLKEAAAKLAKEHASASKSAQNKVVSSTATS